LLTESIVPNEAIPNVARRHGGLSEFDPVDEVDAHGTANTGDHDRVCGPAADAMIICT
jgi:hypothetical protein